ncbi:hypothetical protein JXM67_04915 [candidate division WOR-3 bacterium]|nr:hypothetical protein [candidate division WOR-3 bacterium]
MRRTILATILAIASLGAIEITVPGGMNYQRWKRMWAHACVVGYELEDPKEYGFGFHGGALLGLSVLPELRLEGGCLYQKDNVTTYYPSDGMESRSYNNVVFPMLVALEIKLNPRLELGFGSGLSANRNISGTYKAGTHTIVLSEDELEDYWGWFSKAYVGIEIMPCLWLKPAMAANIRLPVEVEAKKQSFFFSLELTYRPWRLIGG